MPQTNRTAQRKRRSNVVLALGAAGLSLSLASSASAAIGGMKAGAASGGGENDIRIFVVANDRYPQTSTQSAPAQQKKSHAKKNRSSLEAAYALIYGVLVGFLVALYSGVPVVQFVTRGL